jgi:hypothetical protein
MRTGEGKRRPGRVVEGPSPETGFIVAVGALRELQAFEGLVHVALRACHRAMGAGELERGLRVIEAGSRVLERHRRRVAHAAIGTQAGLVDVRVAGGAGRRQRKERPRLVALCAVPGDRCMAAVHGEPGFRGVIERLRIERPQLGVGTGMLDVTRRAIIRHVAVDTPLQPDPIGHRLVAGEAELRRDFAAGLVALLALVRALERRVCARQRAGRQELPDLRTRRRGRYQHPDCDQQESEEPQARGCSSEPRVPSPELRSSLPP